MEYQTWTRKSNAVKAVQAALADVDEKFLIVALEAEDVSGLNEDARWAVKVELENVPSEAAELQEIIGAKAEVWTQMTEDDGQRPSREEEAVNSDDATLGQIADKLEAEGKGTSGQTDDGPVQRRIVNDRQDRIPADARLKVNGGGHATNPYREGTKSHAAFALIQSKPGITRAEFAKLGGRQRTLTEDVKAGRVRVM